MFGLITYVGVFYLNPPERWWGQALPDWRWSLIAGIVTLIALQVKKPPPPAVRIQEYAFVTGLVVFVGWLTIQSLWAMNLVAHLGLLELFAKYVLFIYILYRCLDSEKNVKLFLWAHVLGCGYWGWIVFNRYASGRFEGFGGPGVSDANAGALQMVTGVIIAASLFLAGRWLVRAALLGVIPFILNGVIATISRSGFLALALAGAVFNVLGPVRLRRVVLGLSVLALILFLMLTNAFYWERIGTIQFAGETVAGVDTGSRRLALIEAQWRMFQAHPMGCGHRCTEVLSTSYLDASQLSSKGGRSSHNTFMSLLVEQGIIGAAFYVLMLVWIAHAVLKLWRRLKGSDSFFAILLPATAASLIAVTIGDMFVDYLKFETRLWFITLLMVMLNLTLKVQPELSGMASGGKARDIS